MEVLKFHSSDGIAVVTMTTGNIQGVWRRFHSRIDDLRTEDIDEAMEYCEYNSSQEGSLYLTNFATFADAPESVGNGKHWEKLPPVVYETNTYNVNIRLKGLECQPKVVHKLKEVTELFTCIDLNDGEYLLTAPLSFLNEPGDFRLEYSYKPIDGQWTNDWLQFQVVSPKLDTKNDYHHILEEINKEYNELVFQYLTKTFQNLSRGNKSDNDIIWLSIFRDIVAGYIKAVGYIINRPHLKVRREVHFNRADRIKRWTPQMSERYFEVEREQKLDTTLFRNEIAETTVNTRENRFVKFTLERIGKRLDKIFRTIIDKDSDKITEDERAELRGYQVGLRKLQNNPLFRKLRGEPLRNESMVLQKRTGYAQVYRYWLMLQSGIELFDGNNSIGVRPVWELYELWCFLKMRELVGDILGEEWSIDEDKDTMLNPFTDSKLEHKVTFSRDQECVELIYQHTYNRSSGEVHTATTDNRPDFVLNIVKSDGFVLTYLFDAKYRVIDDDKFAREDIDEQKLYGAADYPPSDAINQMHRYRDAIYYGQKSGNRYNHTAKEIIGGYILFPGRGNDEAMSNRYFIKSIEEVNIGAFPLLPDHENPKQEGSLLRKHLEKILLEQTTYEQIKDSIPQKGLSYTSEIPDDKLVYVGTVLKENPMIEDFKNNEAAMYYTGTDETPNNLNLQDIKYFMPIVGGKVQGVYEVVGINAARKKDKTLNEKTDNDGVRFFIMLGEFIPMLPEAVQTRNRLHHAETYTYKEASELLKELQQKI